jgi:hypothetical protein
MGSAGHVLSVALLLAAGLGIAISLLIRPPRDVRAATWRLAIGLALMFLLGPQVRFGYFIYPLGLVGWLALIKATPPARRGNVGRAKAAPVNPGTSEDNAAPPRSLPALPVATSAPARTTTMPHRRAPDHDDATSSWLHLPPGAAGDEAGGT